MRRRSFIHKGIQKKVTAIGRRFVVGTSYVASIYNPKDRTLRIVDTQTCVLEDEKNKVKFVFSGELTDLLKVGYATLEIYDSAQTQMFVAENFALIRRNSLPITPIEVDTESES